MNDLSVSVVLPVRNGEAFIADRLAEVSAYVSTHTEAYEIIVVDDGSTDRTVEVAVQTRYQNLVLVRHAANQGKGAAVRQGMLQATYAWVLFADADLSIPMATFDAFQDALAYDIIIGSKSMPNSRALVRPPWARRVASRAFNLWVRGLAVRGICDTQGGFKAFRKPVAQHLFAQQTLTSYAFDVEILYLARKYQYRVKEIPMTWSYSQSTTLNLLNGPMRMFVHVAKIRLHDLQGRYSR